MHQHFDSVDQRFNEFQARMNLMDSKLDAYSFQPFLDLTPPSTQPSPPLVPTTTHASFEDVFDVPSA